MKFLREIPENKISTKIINDLEQFGFTLIWKESSVEVWAQIS